MCVSYANAFCSASMTGVGPVTGSPWVATLGDEEAGVSFVLHDALRHLGDAEGIGEGGSR